MNDPTSNVSPVANLLSSLFTGVVEDSAGATAAKLATPYIRMGADFVEDMLIQGIINPKTRYKLGSYGRGFSSSHAAWLGRSDAIAGDGQYRRGLTDYAEERAAIAVAIARGAPNEAEARKQLSTPEGFITKTILGILDGGRTRDGIGLINRSMARRFNVSEIPGVTEEDRIENFKETRQKFVQRLYNNLENREYGSLGITEVGSIVEKLTSTGRHDNWSNADSGIAKLLNEVKGYSKIVESLRTAFDGDVKKLFQKMNALSGGGFVGLGKGQLQQTADAYQHAALVTGIRDARLHTLASTMYTQGVAMSGGDERFASNAAVTYSYFLSAKDITTPGVTKQGLERYYAQQAGRVATTGVSRNIATAYTAYRMRYNLDDTADSYKRFTDAAERAGVKDSNDYLKFGRRLAGSDRVFRAIQESPYTDIRASDSNIVRTAITANNRKPYDTWVRSRDSVLNSSGLTADQREKIRGNIDQYQVFDLLYLTQQVGLSPEKAARVSERLKGAAQRSIPEGSGDWKVAFEAMTRLESGTRQMNTGVNGVTANGTPATNGPAYNSYHPSTRLSSNPVLAIQQVFRKYGNKTELRQIFAAIYGTDIVEQEKIDASNRARLHANRTKIQRQNEATRASRISSINKTAGLNILNPDENYSTTIEGYINNQNQDYLSFFGAGKVRDMFKGVFGEGQKNVPGVNANKATGPVKSDSTTNAGDQGNNDNESTQTTSKKDTQTKNGEGSQTGARDGQLDQVVSTLVTIADLVRSLVQGNGDGKVDAVNTASRQTTNTRSSHKEAKTDTDDPLEGLNARDRKLITDVYKNADTVGKYIDMGLAWGKDFYNRGKERVKEEVDNAHLYLMSWVDPEAKKEYDKKWRHYYDADYRKQLASVGRTEKEMEEERQRRRQNRLQKRRTILDSVEKRKYIPTGIGALAATTDQNEREVSEGQSKYRIDPLILADNKQSTPIIRINNNNNNNNTNGYSTKYIYGTNPDGGRAKIQFGPLATNKEPRNDSDNSVVKSTKQEGEPVVSKQATTSKNVNSVGVVGSRVADSVGAGELNNNQTTQSDTGREEDLKTLQEKMGNILGILVNIADKVETMRNWRPQ